MAATLSWAVISTCSRTPSTLPTSLLQFNWCVRLLGMCASCYLIRGLQQCSWRVFNQG
jgi:hypothetical protein